MNVLRIRRLQIILALGIFAALASGCGTYRTTFIRSQAKADREAEIVKTNYSHGFGIAGGGGFFFAIHRMLPCFVDWTGPVDLSQKCPGGFYKVEHYHTFGQNTVAAFVSWLIILNPYHSATVEITPAG